MKIAIMGTGGQGGLFGSLLAKAGNDVSLIARGKNLEVLQEKGIKLKSRVFGDVEVTGTATDDPKEIGLVDLVLMCVKTYDLDEATELIKPMIGPDTMVLTVQNGVEAPYRVGELIGSEHVVAGVSVINAHLTSPGFVTHHGGKQLIIGELDNEITPRVKRLENVFKDIGFDIRVSGNIKWNLWRKLTTLSGFHGVCCLIRSPIGTVFEFSETRDLMYRVILETSKVALADGIEFPDKMVEDTVVGAGRMPKDTEPSMLVDLLAGRRIELDTFNGAVVRFGKKYGVNTPYNYAIYAALLPYLDGPPK
jgi:2-dehydropantoate 2-reductase